MAEFTTPPVGHLAGVYPSGATVHRADGSKMTIGDKIEHDEHLEVRFSSPIAEILPAEIGYAIGYKVL